jgi:hypothetical protein
VACPQPTQGAPFFFFFKREVGRLFFASFFWFLALGFFGGPSGLGFLPFLQGALKGGGKKATNVPTYFF